jgi:hypothetical protein
MAVTNQNLIHGKNKRRLDAGNAWYHLFQSPSSHLMFKNEQFKYKAIILPAALYGCETCCLTLIEDHRLRVFESRVLREYLDPRGMK